MCVCSFYHDSTVTVSNEVDFKCNIGDRKSTADDWTSSDIKAAGPTYTALSMNKP